MQDLPTLPLFCFDCEQRLSRDEKSFKEKLFAPILEEFRKEFEYEEWLLRFAVSLAFRTICYYEAINPERDPVRSAQLLGASYRWQKYLLGKEIDPGPGEHHMFVADPVTQNFDGARRAMNTYLLRSVSVDIIWAHDRAVVVSKLPWFLFASEVTERSLVGWNDTKIATSGKVPVTQSINDEPFIEYMLDRATEGVRGIKSMSAKQQEVVSRQTLGSPERVLNSQTFDLY
ncbi:MAG: hypothetical protein EOP10_35200, partial [Proteobacteria bacterium]